MSGGAVADEVAELRARVAELARDVERMKSEPRADEQFLGVKEAARLYGVHDRTIRGIVRDNPQIAIRVGGKICIRRSAIEKPIEEKVLNIA